MTSYIALDWGSTNLRAWWIQNGLIKETRNSSSGVTQLNGLSFEAVFKSITLDWPIHDIPIFMAGMVGSNVGWFETEYLNCPICIDNLYKQLTHINHVGWIIPGICNQDENNYNVIRGEETQLLGAYKTIQSNTYILPGTHSKWISMERNKVTNFKTFMTGELRSILLSNSLIGKNLPEQIDDSESFYLGLENAVKGESIISNFFQLRARYILGFLAQEKVGSFLSGLLIGHEINSMGEIGAKDDSPVVLISGGVLEKLYKIALNYMNKKYEVIDSNMAFLNGIRSMVYELESQHPIDSNFKGDYT